MITRRRVLSAAPALALGEPAFAVPAKVARVAEALRHRRFVSYQPTAIKAYNGNLTQADDASIVADLKVLRPWFDGLVTYSAVNGAERVADIAATLGFKAVVLGIFDIRNETEIANAIAACKRNARIAVGCSVGNETMLANRGTWQELASAIARVRGQVPVAVGTTEPFAEYLDHRESSLALSTMDFMLANIHPIFETWFKSGTAANWTEFVASVSARLKHLYRGPILVKETGVPSGPASSGFTDAMQHDFWRTLEKRMHPSRRCAFSYFSAFNSPWRAYDATPVSGPRPEEAHWGLFTEQRVAKPVMKDIPAHV